MSIQATSSCSIVKVFTWLCISDFLQKIDIVYECFKSFMLSFGLFLLFKAVAACVFINSDSLIELETL